MTGARTPSTIFAAQMPIKLKPYNLPAIKAACDKNSTYARKANRTRDAPRGEGLRSFTKTSTARFTKTTWHKSALERIKIGPKT
jgi:hypothetical protein